MSEQIPQQQYTNIPTQPKDSTMALLSMIFGISAYVVLWGIGAIVAVILGHLAKNEIKKSAGMIKGNGMATAGLILGYVQIGLIVLSICVITILALSAGSITDVFNNINGSLY
jgi:hypothetical protein